jgi:hypothetical protein
LFLFLCYDLILRTGFILSSTAAGATARRDDDPAGNLRIPDIRRPKGVEGG